MTPRKQALMAVLVPSERRIMRGVGVGFTCHGQLVIDEDDDLSPEERARLMPKLADALCRMREALH